MLYNGLYNVDKLELDVVITVALYAVIHRSTFRVAEIYYNTSAVIMFGVRQHG